MAAGGAGAGREVRAAAVVPEVDAAGTERRLGASAVADTGAESSEAVGGERQRRRREERRPAGRCGGGGRCGGRRGGAVAGVRIPSNFDLRGSELLPSQNGSCGIG